MLKRAGIRTSARLLEAARTPRQRKALAQKTGIDERQILAWASMADRMRVPGLGKEYADLLQAAGVHTVNQLRYRNPQKLAQAMRKINDERKLVRVMPSEQATGRWVDHAKNLPLKIRY